MPIKRQQHMVCMFDSSPGRVPALVPGQGSGVAGPREEPLLQPGDPDHLTLLLPHLLLLLLHLPHSGQRTALPLFRRQPCSGAHQKVCRVPAHSGRHDLTHLAKCTETSITASDSAKLAQAISDSLCWCLYALNFPS